MVDVRGQIEDYLNLLGMKHSWNEETGTFELLFTESKNGVTADSRDAQGTFRYTIYVRPTSKWIQIFTDVYPLEKIPDEKRGEVFLDLLAANRKYAEVCFDLEESSGYIGSSQEMMVQGLNFDGFREEFLAVPWAVRQFWTDIAKKHNLL